LPYLFSLSIPSAVKILPQYWQFLTYQYGAIVEKTRKIFGWNLSLFAMKKLLASASPMLKRYFSEKNALTVMASFFCLVMMLVAFGKQSWWECIAFALAFSFSVEVICHRAKEK